MDPFAAGLKPLPITAELLERWEIPLDKYLALGPQEKLELQRDLTLRELGRLRRLEILRELSAARCLADHRKTCGLEEKPCRSAHAQECAGAWRRLVTPRGLPNEEGLKLLAEYEAALKDKPLAVPAKIALERKDGKKLTEEDLSRAQEILDRMFDGITRRRAELLGESTGEEPPGHEITWDARFRNGTLYSLTATNPKTGLSFEIGQLGVDGRTPLLAPSWYANLTKRWESAPESWVDYRVHAQIGYVDLKARYFNDPAPDPRVDRVFELGRKLGIPDEKLRRYKNYVDYDDAYRTHSIVATSLLTELGRAYNLFGPVDVSWTVGNLTKIIHLGGNTAFDETLGFRVKLAEGLSLGVFGGAAQNLSPISNRPLQEALTPDKVDAGLYLENAPHATAVLWGRVPGLSDVRFSASAGQRWNKDTTVRQGEGALMTTLFDRPLSLRGVYSRESGPAIEFDREKVRAQLEYQVSNQAQAYVSYERERIRYGNAEVDSDMFLAGFEVLLGGGSTLSIEQVFGKDFETKSLLGPHVQETLGRVNADIAKGLDAAAKAHALYQDIRAGLAYPQIELRLNELSLALQRLSAEATQQLLSELDRARLSEAQRQYLSHLLLRTISRGSQYQAFVQDALAQYLGRGGDLELFGLEDLGSRVPELARRADRVLRKIDDAAAFYAAHKDEVRELAGLLANEQVWDAAVVRAGRAAMIAKLSKGKKFMIPVIDREIHINLSAPVILAFSNIAQSRLSPMHPVRQGDVEPWLLRKAAEELELKADVVTEDMIVARLFEMAGAEIKRRLAEKLSARLDGFLAQGTYDPAALADRVLSALPPTAAEKLKERYGVDLAGLLPGETATPEQVKDFLMNRLTDELMAFLKREFGPEIAKGIAQMVSWAGDIMRREINMTLIQLLLASEELNRLTVDKGLKVPDLNLRMALSSFEKLDERSRRQAGARLRSGAERLAQEAGMEEARLCDKFRAYGKASLESLELDPSWPKGLRIAIDDSSWLPLLALYGDGNLFALVDRLRKKYAAKPATEGRTVTLWFNPNAMGGTAIRPSRSPPGVTFELSRPPDLKNAEFRLSGLEDYLY